MARKRIHLLMVVIDLVGGTGTFCRTLAAGLRRFFPDEFELSLLLVRERGVEPGDRAVFSRIDVIQSEVHNDWRRAIETPIHVWRLGRAIRRIPADLVFTISTYANLLAPLLAPRRRIILSVHTNTTEQIKVTRFGGLIGRLMRWGYPRRPIIVPAQGVADDLQRNFDVRDVTVIPHGVDALAIQSLADEPTGDLPQRPYMVACGRLSAQKDYPTLLRAYAIARQSGIEDDLVIVGDGPDRQALEQLADSLGIAAWVHFVGHRANPFPFMRQARFFVLSSIWEGFGLVLLEAMALGLPCIATDCPSGPAEILDNGQAGLLVAMRDPAALAAAIHALGGSADLRESFSRRSRQRARQLGVERMVRAYRDCFVAELNRED